MSLLLSVFADSPSPVTYRTSAYALRSCGWIGGRCRGAGRGRAAEVGPRPGPTEQLTGPRSNGADGMRPDRYADARPRPIDEPGPTSRGKYARSGAVDACQNDGRGA